MTRRAIISKQRRIKIHKRSLIKNPIPDVGDLKARYNAQNVEASQGETVSDLPDLSENTFNLTAGVSPVYIKSGINGHPVIRFNGDNAHLSVNWSNISQPFMIFAVFQLQSYDTSINEALFGTTTSSDSNRGHLFIQTNSDDWRMFGGSVLDGGSPDTNPHILTAYYDGTSSYFRLDGADILSGDAGTAQSDGFTLGGQDGGSYHANVDFGELLFYPQNKTSIQSQVEEYLSYNWDVSLI